MEDIREHGIVLENAGNGSTTITRVNAVERLEPDDAYELVVVMMPKNHIPEILPILAANGSTPNVLFMFNSAAGPDQLIQALGRERVLIGFPGAGGTRDGHIIRYRIVSRFQQPTTFGELDGSTTPRLKRIAGAFKKARFPVAICSEMDAWLKTNVVEVSPMANALFMAGGDNLRLADTREDIVTMIRAIREGYQVLQELGIPVTPPKHKIIQLIPEAILVVLVRRIFRSEQMADFLGHAQATRVELTQIADEFMALGRAASLPTPSVDRLYQYH